MCYFRGRKGTRFILDLDAQITFMSKIWAKLTFLGQSFIQLFFRFLRLFITFLVLKKVLSKKSKKSIAYKRCSKSSNMAKIKILGSPTRS